MLVGGPIVIGRVDFLQRHKAVERALAGYGSDEEFLFHVSVSGRGPRHNVIRLKRIGVRRQIELVDAEAPVVLYHRHHDALHLIGKRRGRDGNACRQAALTVRSL
ncbi:hypothetical protein D3C72_2093930 [compost metagenome]